MKLSIVTIAYQNLSGLQRTIESLRSQSDFDFEHWIVDGGSSDGTIDYLKNLNVPWQLTWVSEKDHGRYDAMNKGTSRAMGQYVWYLNAGDQASDPEVIKDLNSAIERQQGADLIYGKIIFEAPWGSQVKGRRSMADDFRWGMPVSHPGILFRRGALESAPYQTKFQIISDWILVRRLFVKGSPSYFFDRTFAKFDTTGVSSLRHFLDLQERLVFEPSVLEKLAICFKVGPRVLALIILQKTGIYPFYKRCKLRFLSSRRLV